MGAVATQSIIEPAYGPRGLELMRGGMSAPAALDRLLADDSQEDVRQVAILDGRAGGGAHRRPLHRRGRPSRGRTGLGAGEHDGPANGLGRDARGLSRSIGRSRRSAAGSARRRRGGGRRPARPPVGRPLVVVAARASGRPTGPAPRPARGRPSRPGARAAPSARAAAGLREGGRGRRARRRGDSHAALAEYAAAHREQPDNTELAFWHGAYLAAVGREEEARQILRQVFDGRARLGRAPAPAAGGGSLPRRPGADRAAHEVGQMDAEPGASRESVPRSSAHLREGRRRRERRRLIPPGGARAEGRARRRRRRPRRRRRARLRSLAAGPVGLPPRRPLQGEARRSRAGSNKHGATPEPLEVRVPPGTVVEDPERRRPLGPPGAGPACRGRPRRRRRARQPALRHRHAADAALRREGPAGRGALARAAAQAARRRRAGRPAQRGQVLAAGPAHARAAEGGRLPLHHARADAGHRSSATSASSCWPTSPA